MHLNIKNDKTYNLAATAARLTGKSLTQTVTDALSDYLFRLQQQKKIERKQGLADKLTQLAQEYQKLPSHDERNHADILYDDDGLPKSRRDI
ncbi:MAG: type II toxin-antitoxin system VapB family antitoxin [Opitutales bacterium]|nr:type II toxin-antitoxin system VapB family antitoxin [Opitutales bacterium]NRA26708.1 type II toxin-antitoxin system VapB family antitoxin [Opitutales bacterium]